MVAKLINLELLLFFEVFVVSSPRYCLTYFSELLPLFPLMSCLVLEELFVAAGPAVGAVEAASPAVVAAAAGAADFEGGVFC